MLEVTATPYDGIMYFDGGRVGETQTPWDVRKPSSQLGYMPIYTGPELPGVELSESGAIVRHLARLGGLSGKDNAEACMADMIFEASKSIPNLPGGWRVDDVLLGGGDLTKMKSYLARVEKLLVGNASGALKHFVGSALTFGDIGMFMALQVLEETEPGVIKRLGFDACVALSFSPFGIARSRVNVCLSLVAWCMCVCAYFACTVWKLFVHRWLQRLASQRILPRIAVFRCA